MPSALWLVPSVIKEHQCPTGVLLHPVGALCIDNNKTPTLFLQALIEEELRRMPDCDPMINTIAISAILVLTDVFST